MKKSEKTTNNYYLIDELFVDDQDFDVVVNEIMRIVNTTAKYERQPPNESNFSPYSVRVYLDEQTRAPQWRSLTRGFVSKDANINKSMISKPSHITFIGYKKRIFAITGGSGSFAINNYVSQRFGIDILCRLIDKDSPVIKGISDRRLAGSLLGQAKEFRNVISLRQENNFGQVLKALKAGLSKTTLVEKLGIKEENIRRNVSSCFATSSFRLNKSMSPEESLEFIGRLDELMDQRPNFSINNVEHISDRKSAPLRKRLVQAVEEQIFRDFLENRALKFDFLHPEMEKYFSGVYYQVTPCGLHYDEEVSLEQLLMDLKVNGIIKTDNIREFRRCLHKMFLESLDEDGASQTKRPIWDHICGEISVEGEVYFLLNKEWFRIKPGFVRELNVSVKQALVKYCDDTLIMEPFDPDQDEAVFNMKFVDKPGYLVLDTIVADNIELCDVLYNDASGLYIAHIKKGFSGTISRLTSQVLMSARRVIDDIHTDYSYLDKIDSMLAKAVESNSEKKRRLGQQKLPQGGLKELFKEKGLDQVYYCLVFADTVKSDRLLKENPDMFDSNMAKYTLVKMIEQIEEMGFGLKIVQLKTIAEPTRRKNRVMELVVDMPDTSAIKKKRGRPRKN